MSARITKLGVEVLALSGIRKLELRESARDRRRAAREDEAMATVRTIDVSAKDYEDDDDCLSAAVIDVARDQGVERWQCTARWDDDDQRNAILVEVQS